jgi:hypothetical protein
MKELARPFDVDKALRVCELVALGKTYDEIFGLGDATVPAITDFLRWSITEPELTKALSQARELSAYVLEDEAVSNARHIAKNPGTPQKVSAYKAALDQLRWSAERRNANAFGSKGVGGGSIIPIQIVTSLNLGQPDAKDIPRALDIYTASVELLPDNSVVVDTTEAPPTPKGLMSAAELVKEQEQPAKAGGLNGDDTR